MNAAPLGGESRDAAPSSVWPEGKVAAVKELEARGWPWWATT
jgi:hypothetical protein